MDPECLALADLVTRMRQAQKSWFRDRRQADLQESKRLEREVDFALERLRQPRAEPSLFDKMR